MPHDELPRNKKEAVNLLLANGWNYFVATSFVRNSKELQKFLKDLK